MEKYRPTQTLERPKTEAQNSEQASRFNPNSFPPQKNLDTQIHLVKNPLLFVEGENIRAKIGKTYIGSAEISVTKTRPKTSPSDTSRHEALHAFLMEKRGGWVKKTSRNPGHGYSGITESNRFDVVAAVGPHSVGMSGTGFDMHIAEMSGENVWAAEITARNLILNHEIEINEIAIGIEEQGTLNGNYIGRIRSEASLGQKFEVEIKTIDGNKKTFETRSNNHVVSITKEMIPNKEISLAA